MLLAYDESVNQTDTPNLPALPFELQWQQLPESWELDEPFLSITAGAQTDLFTDPQGSPAVTNAPRLTFLPQGDFTFTAKVTVGFKNTFDAGVLLLYQNETSWAKLCFEFAPQGFPLVVSVVNKGNSDDCNGLFVDENNTWLRVARVGNAFAFHHSLDGDYWHLVRLFALEPDLATQVGFLVQAPAGDSCTALFSKLSFQQKTLSDVRSGV